MNSELKQSLILIVSVKCQPKSGMVPQFGFKVREGSVWKLSLIGKQIPAAQYSALRMKGSEVVNLVVRGNQADEICTVYTEGKSF